MEFTQEQVDAFFKMTHELQDQLGENICVLIATPKDAIISSNIEKIGAEASKDIFCAAAYALTKNLIEYNDVE